MPMPAWTSPNDVADALAATGYLPDARIAQVVYLAGALDKPILAEGPAGVGKTSLALSLVCASLAPRAGAAPCG